MSTKFALTALILAAGCTAGSAFANPLDVALPYNYFVFSNVLSTGDVTGRIAAGGTIQAGQTFGTDIGNGSDPYSLSSYQFSVYAAKGMTSGYSNVNKGDEYIPSPYTGNFNQNGGGKVLQSCGSICIDFQAAATSLKAYSTQLSQLKDNGTVGTTTDPSNPSFFALVGSDSKLNVFTVSAADFQSKTLDIRTPSGSTTIVNVTGSPNRVGGGLVINGTQYSGTQSNGAKILFNFASATTLTVDQQFSASILAPLADFSGTGQIDGNIIVSSVTSNSRGEVHDALFTGQLNLPNATNVSTPEPMSFATLGGGLIALGWFAKRRKRCN